MEKHLTQENGFLNQFADGLAKLGPDATLEFLVRSLLPRLRKANLAEVHPLVLNSIVNNVCAKILIATLSQPLSPAALDFLEFASGAQLLSPVFRVHFEPFLADAAAHFGRGLVPIPPTIDHKIPENYDLKLTQTQPAPVKTHGEGSEGSPVRYKINVQLDSHSRSSGEQRHSLVRSRRSHSFNQTDMERVRGGDSRVSPNKRSPSKRSPSKRSPSKRSPSKRSPSKRSPTRKQPKCRSRGQGSAHESIARQNQQSKLSSSHSDDDFANQPATGLTAVVNRLLNFESKQEKGLNKNFGFALMELNGDFVWCDPNSEKYFEIKSKELSCRNFFDMLIPFSKAYLSQKFGGSLFAGHNAIGASVSFSYVIYSKNSMNKFLKCLKKIGVSSEEEFKVRLKRKDSEDAIYHQYLKALSTRATLILLKFTDSEVQKMMREKQHSLNITRSFAEGLEKRPAERRGADAGGGDRTGGTGGRGQPKSGEAEAKPGNPKGNASKGRAQAVAAALEDSQTGAARDAAEPKVMIRQFVLLETRLALNVPMFDYRRMSDDPKIKSFEQKIIKKITKG